MLAIEKLVTRVRNAVVPDGLARACQKPYVSLLQMLTRGRGLPRTINGEAPIRIDPKLRYTPEDYEPAVFDWIKQRLSPGNVIYDVGAHIGIYAILCARWVGQTGKVYAFEPSRETVSILRQHLQMNPEGNRVEVVQAAVGAAAGTAAMLTLGTDVQNTLCAQSTALPGAEIRQVPVLALDEFYREHPVIPALVKVDTEGWELHVLRGATELLRVPQTRFVVEMHPYAWPQAGYDRSAFETFLNEQRLTVIPLTGQVDPLAEYGDVYLQASDETGAI